MTAQILLFSTAAWAQEAEEDPFARRWIPGGSFYTAGLPQNREASGESDASAFNDGDSVGFPWSVGISAELASPELPLDFLGNPRWFAHADIGYVFDTEEPVASEGDPGAAPALAEDEAGDKTLEGIENVGDSVRIETQPLILTAGTGAIFSFEAWERKLHVRPSIEWMYSRDRIRTILGAAENEVPGGVCGPCRTVYITAQTEKGFHSVGPGIDLELEAGRVGDFMLGVYSTFRAMAIVGDRKVRLDQTGAWERTDGQPTTREDTTYRARYERDLWHYRFGVGLRVSWMPE